jgi:hypothetical protein
MFFAGYLGDKITLRLAKRRNGVHIPEDSLVSLIFPTIVCAIGIAVYAVSANDTEKYTSWGIIMGEHFSLSLSLSLLGILNTEGNRVGGTRFVEAGTSLLTRLDFFSFYRLDPPTIRLRSMHHHHHALRRRSLPEQPGPGARSCSWGEEYRFVW